MFEPRTRWIVAEAVQNIQLKRTRVLLTLVGIVISTAAVVAILTIGWNAANESVRRFSALGVNLFVVSNLEQGQALSESRMADEKRALQNTFPFVERVATVFSLSTRVKVHHRQADAVVYAGDELFRPLIAGSSVRSAVFNRARFLHVSARTTMPSMRTGSTSAYWIG